MARTVKDPEERRSELIACAQKLFYSKGYERTSINDIVKEVGVAKGTFYYYFDSKQAILEAMIDELVAYSVDLMRPIIENSSLNAVEKWIQALRIVGNWKVGLRSELGALLKMMYSDENALLRFKTNQRTVEMLSPELAKIIAQGIDEGVFDTRYRKDSAKIAFGSALTFSDEMYDLLINPEQYENPADVARCKIAAVQDAVERILGAEPGSLPLAEPQLFDQWFNDEKELNVQ
jgi:AcrR family transcriptional regulator